MTIRSSNVSHSLVSRLLPLAAVLVASSAGGCRTALAFSFAPSSPSHCGSASSSSSSAAAGAGARRRQLSSSSSSSLNYRSSSDVDGERDLRYWYGIASYKEGEEEEDEDDGEDDDSEDPLSRELRHGHFPDAIMGALGTLFPKLPASWVATSEAMENIVGGAGGVGLFLHLNEVRRATAVDVDNDYYDDRDDALPLRPSSFADGIVETARAFVPVVVEFGVVDAVAKHFN
jgi:hypothetical protein